MTDREYSKQKARVQKYLDSWLKTIGLGWYSVLHEWERGRCPQEHGTVAMTETKWQYRQAGGNE